MSQIKKIADKQIKVQKPDANLSTFGFLLSSIIQYHSSKKRNVEDELKSMGEGIGVRLLELIYFRNNKLKKETKHLDMIQFIANTVWKTLFGKNADGIFPQQDQKYGYLIRDDNPTVLRYISEVQGQSGAALVSGIIQGILNHSGFEAEVVHDTVYEDNENNEEVSKYPATFFSINFAPYVVEREK
ncbi:hypothetical protein ABPG74_005470 [Tetrahymena malaccensis]